MSTKTEHAAFDPHAHAEHHAWQGAFLLVIPGTSLIGVGVGMMVNHLVPLSLVGLGAGMLVWGLVASFRNRPLLVAQRMARAGEQ